MCKDIKLSFWNYVPFGIVGAERVKEWHEMGFNLPMSYWFDSQKDDKRKMLEILDECLKYDMKLIVVDDRTHFHNYINKGKEAFVQDVRAAYEDFGKHPAAFGFFLGDEPTLEETEAYAEATAIVVKEMPNLTPYCNLVPYWSELQNGSVGAKYYDIVDSLIKKSGVGYLGYDQYTQCRNEDRDPEGGIDAYFYGLDRFYDVTFKNGIPFNISLCSVGHWMCRVPTEDDIRWQMYTALAHGARGIVWFYVYQNLIEPSFRLGPFCGNELKRTYMADILSRQNYIFRSAFMEQFNKMELVEVYHTVKYYDKSKLFCADKYIAEITGDKEYPCIISYYKEFDSDKLWASVVNAHQRLSNHITVKYVNGKYEDFWLAPGEMKLIDLSEIFGETHGFSFKR